MSRRDKTESTPEDAAVESEGAAPPDNGAGGDADDKSAAPEVLLAAAEQRAEEAHNQLLRARAELENTRKRTDKEIARIRKYAIEAFAQELLPVKDNLERGLHDDVAAVTVESVREGATLTLKSLEQVFARFGIEEVSPMGEAFDPERHQAMSTVPTGGHKPNTVIEVVQKGYLLNGRLLRPAMVAVATAPGGKDTDEKP